MGNVPISNIHDVIMNRDYAHYIFNCFFVDWVQYYIITFIELKEKINGMLCACIVSKRVLLGYRWSWHLVTPKEKTLIR